MADVAKAHAADLKTQARYDVNYLRYWVDESAGKIFCLVEAPDADAAGARPPRGARARGGRDLPRLRRVLSPSGGRASGWDALVRPDAARAPTAG